MDDCSFSVGQEFSDVKALRHAVKEAAIAQHFELRVVKSDLVRYVAKCAAEGCPWHIRAAKLSNVPSFLVRSIKGKHTCDRSSQTGASMDWIVSFIEEKLRGNMNYKPKDILDDIYKQFGIILPYKQAWRARERGIAVIYGSSEEGYGLLPSYCEQIKMHNPGSMAEVATTASDNRFRQLFVCFFVSAYGFLNGCLPIIGLGKVHLNSKYLGTFLSATSFDSDGGLFPLAFGVVDAENENTWCWFLSKLRKALSMHTQCMPQFTFFSEGQDAAVFAMKREFPNSSHHFCLHHLSEAANREFKNPRLGNLIRKAAYATSVVGFRGLIAEMEEISLEAAKWIQNYPPSCWALAYTEGTCYGRLSSNTDDFNKWILEAQDLPVLQIIDRIHQKLMNDFEERRRKSTLCTSVLAPSAEIRAKESIRRASAYQVICSDEVNFEVVSQNRSDIVNIATCTCSCRDWQLHGIPCSHAAAALLFCRRDVYDFAEKCFTAASYRETYSGTIHPIPGRITWKTENGTQPDDQITFICPPKIRRPRGRPEKKRVCIEEVNREKHTVRCSRCNRCNQTGHYKTTCKAETLNGIEQC